MSTNTSNNNTKQNIKAYENRLYFRSNNPDRNSKNSEVYEWLDYGLSNDNATQKNYNNNNTIKRKLLKKKFIQFCINWAANYHAQSPYLYEITLDDTTITSNNNAMNIDANNASRINTNTINKTKTKKTKKKTINYSNVQFKFHKSIEGIDNKLNINKFNITILLVIFYALYIYDLYDKQINSNTKNNKRLANIHNNFDESIIKFLNENVDYREELNKLKNPNAYKLSDNYINKYYDNFIKTSIEAYHTADDFIKLNGTTYVSSLHGGPITSTQYDDDVPLLFKVPENIKIGFLTPQGQLGLVTDTNVTNYYYLYKDIGFNNIIKLGPSYYQSIVNKLPLYLLNMNIYHTGQLVPNLRLSFSLKLCITNNVDYTHKLKYEHDLSKSTSLLHYIYNKIINDILLPEIKDYVNFLNISSKKTKTNNKQIFKIALSILEENDKYITMHQNFSNDIVHIPNRIFIEVDESHDNFLEMIINDPFLHRNKNIEQLKTIFTQDGIKKDLTEEEHTLLNRISELSNIIIDILKNFNITKNSGNNNQDSQISFITTSLSLTLDKYIFIINNKLKNYNGSNNGGNLYIFNACRHYNKNNSTFKINAQQTISYITNITNKYISYLVNKIPDRLNYTPTEYNSYIPHTINNNVIQLNQIYYITHKINTIPNNDTHTTFKYLVLDMSKDMLILIAISNIIRDIDNLYEYFSFNDKTPIFNILLSVKISFYYLFIKPKYEYDSKGYVNNLKKIEKLKNTQITTMFEEYNNYDINNIIFILNNIEKYINHIKLSILLENILVLLAKYYGIYIKWLINNKELVYYYYRLKTPKTNIFNHQINIKKDQSLNLLATILKVPIKKIIK